MTLREIIKRAIYDAPNGIDGDQLADMLIEDDRITGRSAEECRAQIMAVCGHAADAVLAAIEAAGFVIVPPLELLKADNTELPKLGPKQFEALAELAHYRDQGRRHCWRVASMKKLMAHGLVTYEPGSSVYWDVTSAGRAALAARPRDAAPETGGK